MSKVKHVFTLLFVSLVVLTGCGKKNSLSPQETFEKAIDSMKEVENFKMNVDVNVGMTSESVDFSVSLGADAVIDVKNGKMKMEMNINALGSETSMQMYGDFKNDDNQMIIYSKQQDGSWQKQVSELQEISEFDSSNMDKLFELLESSKMLKEGKSDENNYNYDLVINKETMKQLASLIGENEKFNSDSIEAINGDFIISISIDKETYRYSAIKFDMKDMLNEVMSSTGQLNGVDLSKAEVIITFNDYNQAGNVEIPSSVVKEVVEEGKNYNSLLDLAKDEDGITLICRDASSEAGTNSTLEFRVDLDADISLEEYESTKETYESDGFICE